MRTLPSEKIKTTSAFVIVIVGWLFFISPQKERAGIEKDQNQKYLLTPEQVLNRRQLTDLQLSPDQSRLAFVLAEPIRGAEQKRNIWIYDLQTQKMQQFTYSERPESHPRWSPDGKNLAFLSGRGGTTQIHLIAVDGGEARALTESKSGVQVFAWSPDGKMIAFLASSPATEAEEKKEKEKDDARVVDRDEKNPPLWLIDLESKKVSQLTDPRWRIGEFIWAPQGERLLLSASDQVQPELFSDRIYSLRVRDGKMEEIASPAGPFSDLRISPDGKTLAYIGCRNDGPESHDLFLMPSTGGIPRNLSAASLDRPVSSIAWRKDGTILVHVSSGFTRTFMVFYLDGKVRKLDGLPVSPTGSNAADRDLLAFVAESAVQLPELWLKTRGGEASRISSFNTNWESVPLIRPEILRYPSFDGKEIETALFLPAGYNPKTRVPLVALLHGGPAGAWSDTFNSWAQLLAARGFAVFCPNIRGSTGYGYDFMVLNRRDWGGGDFKDVLAGVDFLIQKGIADPQRLGIGGWSYGGYMAAWAVTQTHRFQASVSGAPMTDLALEYGAEAAGINSYDTWFMGTPYENLDFFQERSPMTFVKNVTTPTLIFCGENDATDPIAQCYQFHRGLKRYKVECDLVVYPREGHGLREEKHQIDMLNRMLKWFEKYLKNSKT